MCDMNKELLHQYIDGDLSPVEKAILQEHINTCADCRRELNQLKLLDWNLRFEEPALPPLEDLARLRTHTLDACFAELETEKDEARWNDVYKIQAEALKFAVNYTRYIPGSSMLKTAGQATGKYLTKRLSLKNLFKD